MNIGVEFTPEEITKALYECAIEKGLLREKGDAPPLNKFRLFDDECAMIESNLQIFTVELS